MKFQLLIAGLVASTMGRAQLKAPSFGSDEDKIKAQIEERGSVLPTELY